MKGSSIFSEINFKDRVWKIKTENVNSDFVEDGKINFESENCLLEFSVNNLAKSKIYKKIENDEKFGEFEKKVFRIFEN